MGGHHHHHGSSFDEIASIYDEAIPQHVAQHYLDKRVRFVVDTAPPPGKLLDVGCGTGVLGARFAEAGYSVTGTDDSEGMLKLAGDRGIETVLGDAAQLRFADSEFDVVTTVAVLHHLRTREAVRNTIREIFRVLRPGGKAIIWDHNPLNPYWPILMRRVPQDDGSERLVSLSEIAAVIKAIPGARFTGKRMGFIPDFLPAKWLPRVQRIEPALERSPLTRWIAAHNVVVMEKFRVAG